MTEPIAWPDWLADLTPEQRVQAILNAVAACYGGDDHDQPATQHCTVSVAEMFLLRLLGEARESRTETPVTPEPVMALLEAAWQLLADAAGHVTGARQDWRAETHAWGERYRSVVAGYAAARAGQPAESEPPQPPGRLANVEVKGFRDLGVVAVSEITLAGVPFLHAENQDGSAADFPASSVHFIAWLPPGSPWPEKPKAIASRPATFGHPVDDDYPDDDVVHAHDCTSENCNGDCIPF
jgi:hypothetical protein